MESLNPNGTQQKPRRKSDGSLESRSIDEMLAHAVNSEEFARLPGKGKPVDLGYYFASGPEHRVAGKILKDNAVLPQPLQDRRDVEQLRGEAAENLAQQSAALAALKEHITDQGPALSHYFADRAALIKRLELSTWPTYLPEPIGKPLPARRPFVARALALATMVVDYNRRTEIAVSQYLKPLRRANELVTRLNEGVASSRHLSQYLQLKTLDLDHSEAAVRATLLPLIPLPADLAWRLEKYHSEMRPSLWRRLIY